MYIKYHFSTCQSLVPYILQSNVLKVANRLISRSIYEQTNLSLQSKQSTSECGGGLVTETGSRFLFHLRQFGPDYITWACQLGTQQTQWLKQKQRANPSFVELFSRRRHQSEISISTSFLILLKYNKHEDIVLIAYQAH